MPEIRNMRPARIAVVGSAMCVRDDWETASARLRAPDLVIAVNHAAGKFVECPDHWVSLHGPEMKGWNLDVRWKSRPPVLWTADHIVRNTGVGGLMSVPYRWDGTSAALAVFVAEHIGMNMSGALPHILLIGVPLINGMHFYDGEPFRAAELARAHWSQHLRELRHVNSMSGWTQEVLGGPSSAWAL